MKANLKNLKKKVLEDTTLPDGTYSGLWGGYIVEFECNGVAYEAETTEVGIKGIDIPCTIEIDGDNFNVITN